MNKKNIFENRLLVLYPEIYNELDIDKNKNDKLIFEDISYGSDKKFWWKCKNGHSWMTSVYSRTRDKGNGSGCPYCIGLRVTKKNSLAVIRPDLITRWSDKNTIDINSVSIRSHKNILWVCENGHEWKSPVYVVTNTMKKVCPYCSGRYPTEENNLGNNNDLVLEWNWKKNDKSPRDYTQKSNRKVWWRCKNNHEWEDTIGHRQSGRGCPYCSGKRFNNDHCLSKYSFNLSKQWNSTKNPPELNPSTISYKSIKKVWWKCENGHEWESTVSHRVRGDGCPYCSGRYPTEENNLGNNNDLVLEWNWDRNNKSPRDYTQKSDKKVWWKCKKGHEWEAKIYHRAYGTNCPFCTKIELKDGFVCSSLSEAYYYIKLKSRNIKFIYDKIYMDDRRFRFDFYIPKYKTYIEITGYNKDSLKRRKGRWFSYLRNIIMKKRYVENVLHEHFRFVQINLNRQQTLVVRRNIKHT